MELAYHAADRRTVLRYLGAAGWTPDAATTGLLDEAESLLRRAATPRGIWRAVPPQVLNLQAAGTDLARHLQGCSGLVLMAVTMGSGADALIRRLELSDIALGAAADATASAAMDGLCDDVEAEARRWAQSQGLWLTGRYSPGYGDCPLTLQHDLCLALDTVRGLGLAVTPQHLLTPRKSVTAILGTADHPVTGARAGCSHCLLRETCAYRKRGMTCDD